MPEVDGTIRGLTAFLKCNSRKCEGCEFQDKKPGLPGSCKLDSYEVIEDAIKLLKEQKHQIENLEYSLEITENDLRHYINGND